MGVSWIKGWWGLAKTVCEEWAGQFSPEDKHIVSVILF